MGRAFGPQRQIQGSFALRQLRAQDDGGWVALVENWPSALKAGWPGSMSAAASRDERGFQDGGEAGVVAAGVGGDGGGEVVGRGDGRPGERVSGVGCELADELALGASVAFAEGVNRIDLAEIKRSAPAEG